MSVVQKRPIRPQGWAAHEALAMVGGEALYSVRDVTDANVDSNLVLRALREVAFQVEELRYLRHPVPMILHCPLCHKQHIDEIDPEGNPGWDNPPHSSHKCLGCGAVWRPSDRPTEGVARMDVHGASDTWPAVGRNVPPAAVEALATHQSDVPAGRDADKRPVNCRDRMREERKAGPRSGCGGCSPKNKHKFQCPHLGEI